MNGYTENKLTEEEKRKIADLASGMTSEEVRCFVSSVESKVMWEELMRRERENSEKLKRLTDLILSV